MHLPSPSATFTQPARWLFYAGLICLATTLLCIGFMTRQPWLGLHLEPRGQEVWVKAVADHMQATVPTGVRLSAISTTGGEAMPLNASDLLEEPDFLDTYAAMSAFFARQSRIYEILRAPTVVLHVQEGTSAPQRVQLTPIERPLSSLPFTFYLQLLCGCLALLIATWVFALRPDDWATRAFLGTGIFFLLTVSPAAIYSSREFALPGELFRLLSILNHAGGMLFGASVVAIFLLYPRRLVSPRVLLVLPLIFVPWWVADSMQWAPNVSWGVRHPILLELVLAVIICFIQWRLSRHRPLDRAALYWVLLSTLTSCTLFFMTGPAANVLKLYAPMSQSYGFAYFLIMYVGIALGLGRYRLFDLDVWAYRLLLWVGGALMVVAMDLALIALGLSESLSLGITLLIAGWLYFPLRQWLWQYFVRDKEVPLESLLPQVSELVFKPEGAAREAQWDALLRRLYDPLEIRAGTTCTRPAVEEEGLALCLPPLNGIQGRTLRFAASGRRLFSSRDAAFATTLIHLADQVLFGREGYERGAQQERQRLARDLHDNIGARLLRLIHHLRGTPDADLARDAMKDLRAAISAIDGRPVPLQEALADWRGEANARCEAAQVSLHWFQEELPPIVLTPRTRANLGSLLREGLSNALRHAAPTRMEIRITADDSVLTLTVLNDGAASDPSRWQEGYGLRSMRGRLKDLGGSLNLSAEGDTVKLCLTLPMKGLMT